MLRAKFGYFPALVLFSAGLFSIQILFPSRMTMVGLCGNLDPEIMWQMIRLQVAVISPLSILAAWALMVGAMMLPLVAREMDHVRQLVRRSASLSALLGFLIGYLFIWFCSGLYSFPLALILIIGLPDDGLGLWVLPILAVFFSFIWSASPIAQLARNRCHKRAVIGFGGLRPLLGSCKFGLRIAVYCHLTCWPWMLVPFLVPDYHITTMVIVTVIIFADRMTLPRKPQWQWPPVFDAISLILPQKPKLRLGQNF